MTDAGAALDVNDARAAIAAEVATGFAEPCPLAAARGRVLAEPVTSPIDLPPFDNSAMDGFALRAADTADATTDRPARLRVLGESRAGVPSPDALRSGAAMRISTGAAMPQDADAVIRVEDAGIDGVDILVPAPLSPGHDVRRRGDDLRAGVMIVPAGRRLSPGDCGAIAALGMDGVSVHRRPRVAIVSTGDELAEPGTELRAGQIYDSNVGMLEHLVAAGGGTVTLTRPRVSDDRAATEEAVSDALAAADVVVIAGGVSVGAHDHVRAALEGRGVRQVFWRVALRPGHPTWFGVRDRASAPPQLVFGLPGNPASAFVTFHLFVAPALDAFEGVRHGPMLLAATYRGGPHDTPIGTMLALRCALRTEGRSLIAEPSTGNQRSHSVRSLVGVDGLILVPPDAARLVSGDPVTVLQVAR